MTTSPPETPPRRFWHRLRVPLVLYAHPFELAFGFVIILAGIKAIVTGDLSPAVNATLPGWLLFPYRVMGLFGGVLVLAGLMLRSRRIGRTLERSALWLVGSSYAAYAVVLFGVNGKAAFWPAMSAIAVGFACVLRALAIRQTQRVILRNVRQLNAEPDLDRLRWLLDGFGTDDPEQEDRHE